MRPSTVLVVLLLGFLLLTGLVVIAYLIFFKKEDVVDQDKINREMAMKYMTKADRRIPMTETTAVYFGPFSAVTALKVKYIQDIKEGTWGQWTVIRGRVLGYDTEGKPNRGAVGLIGTGTEVESTEIRGSTSCLRTINVRISQMGGRNLWYNLQIVGATKYDTLQVNSDAIQSKKWTTIAYSVPEGMPSVRIRISIDSKSSDFHPSAENCC